MTMTCFSMDLAMKKGRAEGSGWGEVWGQGRGCFVVLRYQRPRHVLMLRTLKIHGRERMTDSP